MIIGQTQLTFYQLWRAAKEFSGASHPENEHFKNYNVSTGSTEL